MQQGQRLGSSHQDHGKCVCLEMRELKGKEPRDPASSKRRPPARPAVPRLSMPLSPSLGPLGSYF